MLYCEICQEFFCSLFLRIVKKLIRFHAYMFSQTILIPFWLSHLIHQFAKVKHYILTLLFRYYITIHFTLTLLQFTLDITHHFLYEQFMTEAVATTELSLSEEVLAEKYKDRLQSSYNVICLFTSNNLTFLSSVVSLT